MFGRILWTRGGGGESAHRKASAYTGQRNTDNSEYEGVSKSFRAES
jgi:hypothetical protein